MFRPGEHKIPWRRRRTRSGQSTVEYLLVISVIVIAIWRVTEDFFWDPFSDGRGALQDDVADVVGDGVVSESQQ